MAKIVKKVEKMVKNRAKIDFFRPKIDFFEVSQTKIRISITGT